MNAPFTDEQIKNISAIDPFSTLGKLGIPEEDVSAILAGDISKLLADIKGLDPTLEFNRLYEQYLKTENKEILLWFFDKAKKMEHFTEAEARALVDTYVTLFTEAIGAGMDAGIVGKKYGALFVVIKVGADKFALIHDVSSGARVIVPIR